MGLLTNLIPWWGRWLALAALAAALLGFGYVKGLEHERAVAKAEMTAHLAQDQREETAREKAVAAQIERNRELQRQAEEHYTVQTEVRDRFIVQTITEVRHETANLAACVLTVPARVRLNAAAACAGENRPASCGAGEPLRPAGATP